MNINPREQNRRGIRGIMTDIDEILKTNIKYFREKAGLSQQDLAEKCRISTSFLASIEIGRKRPSLATLSEIAHALDVQPYQLLKPLSEDGKEILDRYSLEVTKRMSQVMEDVKKQL